MEQMPGLMNSAHCGLGFFNNGKRFFIAFVNYFFHLGYLARGKLREIAIKKGIDALAPGLVFHFAFYSRQVMYHRKYVV